MNEEIFDVVNERDEVIARRPRRDVHRLGLRHWFAPADVGRWETERPQDFASALVLFWKEVSANCANFRE